MRAILASRHPRESGDPFRSSRDHVSPQAMGSRFRGNDDMVWLASPEHISALPADHLLVEGGAATAAAFLGAVLVDRLLIYRAPILLGGGTPALGDIGLGRLGDAHGRWRLTDARMLGADRLEVYEAVRS